ncbi:hypothetical protein Aph01nite_23080 [Acrocarpospora phusangensis]|uniref:Calcium-binding protein n=1 Tax=Acrocarpospora phusangensis TaxID=1070424 RepID=A0A919QAV3_9ACTN|nr:hypothetical protein [Acrocarpospora phusangensis]GIH23998.1 hypothetical protein Aph01nite_23080 [Acrocarpospora phusangensis]
MRTTMKKRLARIALLAAGFTALATTLAAPGHASSAASAGTVGLANGKVTYTAGVGGINSASITVFNGLIAVFDTEPVNPLPGCQRLTPRAVTCGAVASEFAANLGDMNDVFSVGVSFPGTVNGGAGNDSLIASTKSPAGRAITWIGGTGTDTVSYKSSELSVRVSLDNRANDGRNVDSDNVRDDVENIVGTTLGGDFLIGSGAVNRIDDAGGSGDKMFGLGGNDQLLAKDLAKDSDLDCGLGVDSIVIDKNGLDPEPVSCETIERF